MRKLSIIACVFCMSLSANTQENSDYVITVKTNSELLDTAGSVNVLKADQIKNQFSSSLKNVLDSTTGVISTTNDRSFGGRQNISFRGLDPRHTLILVDGIALPNTDAQIGHSDFQYNWISLDNIEKIELIRGPMSSLYGSQALGGVVNIITKKAKNEALINLNAKATFAKGETANEQNANLFVSKKFDKFSFNINGEYLHKKEAFYEPVLLNEGLESFKQMGIFKGSSKLKEDTSFEGKKIKNISAKLAYDITDASDVSLFLSKGEESRSSYSPFGVHFDKLYDIDKDLYAFKFNQYTHFGGFSIKLDESKISSFYMPMHYTSKMKKDEANVEFFADALANHYIVFGLNYKKDDFKKDYDSSLGGRNFITLPDNQIFRIPGMSKNFSSKANTKSFYLQDEINFNDKLLLTIGGRFDRHNVFGNNFSPKIYGVYKISDFGRIKLGFAQGFNAPTVTEMSDDYSVSHTTSDGRFEFLGNSKLKPEKSSTYELGYEYSNDTDMLKITTFYNDIKNLIEPQNASKLAPSGAILKIYSNVAKAYTTGFEIEYARKNLFVSNLYGKINYAFLKTKNKDLNEVINFRPEHSVNTQLEYQFSPKYSTFFGLKYIGKQKNITLNETNNNIKQIDDLDFYMTANLQFKAQLNKHLSLRTGVENLFDTKLDYQYTYTLAPRTFYLDINCKF